MEARIYQPTKTAMQSGRANTKDWVLEFAPEVARTIDTLMGWTGSSDMQGQVVIRFATKNEAVTFAEKHGLPYRLIDPHPRTPKKRAYADNYRWDKVG
jgi:hypothetical protein